MILSDFCSVLDKKILSNGNRSICVFLFRCKSAKGSRLSKLRATTDKHQSRGSIPGRPCTPHSSPDNSFNLSTHILYVFLKKKESSFFQGCFILMISIGNFLGFGRQSYVFPESLSLDYLTIFFLLYSHPIYFLKKESSFFQGCFILLISFA